VEDNLDNTATSESSDADLLNDEGVAAPPEEAEPPKSEDLVDPDDVEEEEEVEEKPEEPEEPEEEETEENKITRPSWNELKSKYPGIEKNKELREVYFREKAFSELYSNLDEAKDASEKARILEFFDSSLSDGTPDALLSNLNPQALEGFAEKILPSLRTANKDLFIKATAPVLIDIVNNINESALAKGDKNLETSVLNVCKWLFGDFKIPARVGNVASSPEIEKEKKSLQETREKLIATQRQDFTTRIEKSIGRQLDKIVREGLETDNPFLTDTIVEKTLSRVRDTITSDKDFLSKLSIIYKQAEKSGYPSEYAARVISSYLGRAKGIALKARAEIKATALGKQSTKASGDKTRKVVRTEKGNGEVGKKTGNKVDLRSTRAISDLDILNQS
jgi:hypothetical protein